MKYPVLIIAVALLVSFVVSETLLSDVNSSYEGIRQRRTADPPAAAQPALEHINYRPYSQVPANIKQLLQFQQAREPIHQIASQPPPQLSKNPTSATAQYNPQVQYGAQSQAQAHPQYQSRPTQANYQPQQSPVYQQNHQQIQPAYSPQQQVHGNQQAGPGKVFRPEQRRLY